MLKSLIYVLVVFTLFAAPNSVLLAQSLFQRTYGGTGQDVGNSVQQTSDGGYIIVGTTRASASSLGDVYLIKTNPSGDTLWTRTYGGASDDLGNSVRQTTDGGYIIAGATNSFGAGSSDVYLIKTQADGTVGVQEHATDDMPTGFRLVQNYPNPFNPTTEIQFSVAERGKATLEIFNILGQKIATLFNEVAESGKYYKIKFDASSLASGIYIYRLQAVNFNETRKMLLLR